MSTIKAIIFILSVHLAVGISAAHGQTPKLSSRVWDTIPPKFDSLKEATVTATLRPKIKGDTTEYNTTNVKLHPHANVEQLIGILPGLQVDLDGNITFNGEKIQHLLVDGKDIFSNNPILVTRNFDASKIARIQVLDRKSNQAIFTGMDDGSRYKTINLVLKESERHGYFGKISAGANSNTFYKLNSLLAEFNRKQQFTLSGSIDNIGDITGNNNLGGLNFSNGSSDPLLASAGTGIPHYMGSALHYANDWDRSGNDLVVNYQYGRSLTHPVSTLESIQTQTDTVYRQTQNSQSTNLMSQHSLYGTYQWNSPKTAFRSEFKTGTFNGENKFEATSISRFDTSSINSSHRFINDNVSQSTWQNALLWKLSLRQPDQTLSFGFTINGSTNTTNGYLYSLNEFFPPNNPTKSIDTLDQRKRFANKTLGLEGILNYVHPFSKNAKIDYSYRLTNTINNYLQETFDRGIGKYQTVVDSLTNNYKSQNLLQQFSVNLHGTWKRLSYTLGNSLFYYHYRQLDLPTESVLHQQFLTMIPVAAFLFASSPNSNFRIFYTSTADQPSTAQLQPAKNNNDPLHIFLGNPALKPSVQQTFNFDFRQGKKTTLFFVINYILQQNSITTKTTTDSLGRQVTQPVNTNGGRMANMAISVSKPLAGFNLIMHANENYSRSLNYINDQLNKNIALNSGGGLNLTKNVPDKYVFQINTQFSYLFTSSSINTNTRIKYWTQSHKASATIYFLQYYSFTTVTTYNWQQRINVFSGNTSTLLLNESFIRDFLKNKLSVMFEVKNLLNQNSGIIRTSVNNTNTENTTNMLGRYWLISIIYHFDNKFKQR